MYEVQKNKKSALLCLHHQAANLAITTITTELLLNRKKNTSANFLFNICIFLAKKKKNFKIEGLGWHIRTLEVICQIKAADSWALQFINCQVIKYKVQSSFLMWIKEHFLFTKQLNLNESSMSKISTNMLWK